MTLLRVAVALWATYRLVVYVPSALRALRGELPVGRDGRPVLGGRLVPVANVVLAFVLLVVAVKGLAQTFIRW